ncbi:MAG: preprotein translocase subunit SecY [Christensenellales bacterium]|jgi:preprotein translocase subunit SecY
MLQVLRNAWKVPELKKKILYTLLMLFIFRLASFVPVPGVNTAVIGELVGNYSILGFLDTLTGGSLANYTIMAIGIQAYISASIIMNLLTVAIPALERLAKEEGGRKKINKLTSYVAIGLAFVQAIGITLSFGAEAVVDTSWFNYAVIAICLTAGSMFAVWIGERITEGGVGNGVSLLIFIGIVSSILPAIGSLYTMVATGQLGFWMIIILLAVILLLVTGVTYVDLGERKVPVQYAKKVVGRKIYGGQSTHIPMKVNSTGVLPLIFASVIINFPGQIAEIISRAEGSFYQWYMRNLAGGTVLHMILYALLILFFAYFYTMISFNPVEISKNMQQYGGFIPGIRPGKPTSDYLTRISNRLTLFGAIFLALIAAIPTLFATYFGISSFGATSVLIMVSVALETSKQLESQMLMRHYKGFLK